MKFTWINHEEFLIKRNVFSMSKVKTKSYEYDHFIEIYNDFIKSMNWPLLL